MSPRKSQPRALLHINTTAIHLPLEALNHNSQARLDNLQGQWNTGTPPPSTPKRQKLKMLPSNVQIALSTTIFTIHKPLGPKLERVNPISWVTVKGPDVDKESSLGWNLVARNCAGLGWFSDDYWASGV